MIEIAIHYGLQMLFAVGLIVAFGYAVGQVNRLFYRLVGYDIGRRIERGSGLIGTPVHELGHAVMCVIFAHRIIEIRLYQPNDAEGVLGYVKHTYNPGNLWARIGNFFIGVGPIVFGSLVLLLSMAMLVSPVYERIVDIINAFVGSSPDAVSLARAVVDILAVMFDPANLASIWWWIFIIVSCSIALHMRISTADIRHGWSGFVVIAALLAIVDIVVGLVYPPLLTVITDICVGLGLFVLSFLWIALLVAGLLVLIALAIWAGRKYARNKR